MNEKKVKIKQIKRTYDSPGGGTQLRIFDEDGIFMGYANFGMESKEIGKIHMVKIHPELEKHGLLTAFLPYIFDDLRCRGAEKVVLSAAREKIEIWEKFGFKEIISGLVSVGNMEKNISELSPDCPLEFPEDEQPGRVFENYWSRRRRLEKIRKRREKAR